MKNQVFFYVLLALLVVTDAWLLAHPNLLGKIGIWVYHYNYLKTFPRALATVSLATGSALVISLLVRQWLTRLVAAIVLGILLVGGFVMLVQTVIQFSSGTYVHTGAGFKTGAVLLPFILMAVLTKNLWETMHWQIPAQAPTPAPDLLPKPDTE